MKPFSMLPILGTLLAPFVQALEPPADGAVVKAALEARDAGPNLLRPDAWRPYEAGAALAGGTWSCDNGSARDARRGVTQQVRFDPPTTAPIAASAWSRAEEVGGSRDSDYALYLDLVYADGTPLWGQTADFDPGSHDWQRREVTVLPEKPVRSVSAYLLLRGHPGRALFREPELRVAATAAGACLFDGVPVAVRARPAGGFQLRDAAASSGFVRIDRQALGLALECRPAKAGGAQFFDVELADTTGRDRAVTLVYALAVEGGGWTWLAGPRRSEPAEGAREFVVAHRAPAGANGRLSRWPFAAVSSAPRGLALGLDPDHPAFARAGFNAATRELFLAFDLGLAPERPRARLRFCTFDFAPADGFRGALARYYELFPEAFRCRVPPPQGTWMPFARISAVPDFQDFGFRFKEGNDETAWDDAHGILTFRYTEPMIWWMRMPSGLPRTPEAALAEARRLAADGRNPAARAFAASSYRDEAGRPPLRLLDTPWCNGAVWSINSMPGLAGASTDFTNKWNPALREKLYGPARAGDLDGEYVDSSEGYVTDVLDFRRDHFAATATPLTFSPESHRPAIFRGLIAFEYVRALAHDLHAAEKLTMANGTPGSLWWLVPMLDVAGTETDWNPGGRWQPMSDEELLYRRALCRGKPYCFLMNTDFSKFPHELVERYMRRCLAYGMFPGFFSANASTGQYFQQPALFERDRGLFRKYVPLCRRVAEAGWEPLPRARSSDERVHVERFGAALWTVFNDSAERRTATITLDGPAPATLRELVAAQPVDCKDGAIQITLEPEEVAVFVRER